MTEITNFLRDFIDLSIGAIGIYGPILACFFIVIESIVPVLPLSVFITINFLLFGPVFGFLISWIFTIIGCMISYTLFKHKISLWFNKKFVKSTSYMSKKLEKLKFEHLVTIIAIPFTPAFLVNIAAGLSNISTKKFLTALMIGKISLIYFWGYVGTSLVDSLENPTNLIKVLVATTVAYFISNYVNKRFNFDR